jgi:uncharacterized protein (UPF0335 family)
MKDISLRKEDILVSFDVKSLFSNVPVEEVLQVIKNKLYMDHTFSERSPLKVDDVMELLEVSMKTIYFQFEDELYQQKDGMAMGSSLPPVVSNIFMEHFEKLVLETSDLKPAVLLRYVDDTFVVWPHGPSSLQDFLCHLNSVRPAIQFTMEVETNNNLPFLDVLVTDLSTRVYRKPTHSGRYLHFKSDHPQYVKRGVVRSSIDRVKVICQNQKDFNREVKFIKHDLILNGYPQRLMDSIMKSRKNKNPSTDKVPHSTVVIPYIRGISEKFRRIGNRYNIRTIFKTKHIPRGTLMTIRPDRGLEQTRQCVCSIPCECGRCYIGETSRPLQVRIKEHKHNLR